MSCLTALYVLIVMPVASRVASRESQAAPAAPGAPAALPDGATLLKGPPARLVANMEESLQVPTATSFRELAVSALEARRKQVNDGFAAAGRKDKVSFTHLIAYALVRAAVKHPAMGEVADAFLGAYQHRAGTLPADSLAWWRAAALAQLVGRRYRRLEISEWPLLPSVVEVAESLLPRSTAPRGAASPMARPASLLEAVRDALQQVAAVPELRHESPLVLSSRPRLAARRPSRGSG